MLYKKTDLTTPESFVGLVTGSQSYKNYFAIIKCQNLLMGLADRALGQSINRTIIFKMNTRAKLDHSIAIIQQGNPLSRVPGSSLAN
jgi:hypothetical protein